MPMRRPGQRADELSWTKASSCQARGEPARAARSRGVVIAKQSIAGPRNDCGRRMRVGGMFENAAEQKRLKLNQSVHQARPLRPTRIAATDQLGPSQG